MKFLGYVREDGKFYKFHINQLINERGLVSDIDANGVRQLMQEAHPDWILHAPTFFENYANEITFRANPRFNMTRALRALAESNKTYVLDLDPEQDIKLNEKGTGIITVDLFSGIPELPNVDEAYVIQREDADAIAASIGNIMSGAREELKGITEGLEEEDMFSLLDSLDPKYTEHQAGGNGHDFQIEHIIEHYTEKNKLIYYLIKYGYAYCHLYYVIYDYFIRNRIPMNVRGAGRSGILLWSGCRRLDELQVLFLSGGRPV